MRRLTRNHLVTATLAAMSAVGGPDAEAAVPPALAVHVHTVFTGSVSTGFAVCIVGDVDPASRITGGWDLRVVGTSDAPFLVTYMSVAASVNHCLDVPKNGTTTGAFLALATYGGIGDPPLMAALGGAVWDRDTIGDQTFDTST